MDPLSNPNPGNFGAPIAQGAGDPIAEAMARRGMSGGALNQNSQNPQQVPLSTPPMNAGPAIPPSGGGQSAPPSGSPQDMMPQGNPEAQKILAAMDSYLKSISKVNEHTAGIRPPMPQPSGGQ